MKRNAFFHMALMLTMALGLLLLGHDTAKAATSGTYGTCKWVIDASGVLTISPVSGRTGMLNNFSTPGGYPEWSQYNRTKIKSVRFTGGTVYANTSIAGMFSHLENLKSIDFRNFDVTNVTNTAFMFYNCGVESLNLSHWDVSRVTSMQSMFFGCYSLKTLNITGWDASSCKSMYSMFHGCNHLETLYADGFTIMDADLTHMFHGCLALKKLNTGAWNVSGVTNMTQMFYYCKSLETLDMSNWDVSKTTSMSRMFEGCTSLKELDLSAWDVSSLSNAYQMFYESSIQSIDLSGWAPPANCNLTSMFHECYQLRRVASEGFTIRGAAMTKMFLNCYQLTDIELEKWNVSGTLQLGEMFRFAGLQRADISTWDTSGAISTRTTMMFAQSQLKEANVSNIDLNFYATFEGCPNLERVIAKNVNIQGMVYAFEGCKKLRTLDLSGCTGAEYVGLNNAFENCLVLEEIDLSGLDTTKVVTMSRTFDNCNSLKKLIVPEGLRASNVYTTRFPVSMYEIGHGDDPGAYYGKGELIPEGNADVVAVGPAIYVAGKVVSYDANGGTGEPITGQVFGWGMEEKSIRANAFSNGDLLFAGWNTAPDGSGAAYADLAVTHYDRLPGNVTLYAQWKPAVTITYVLDGGVLNGQTGNIVFTVPKGTDITILNAPEKEGFEFQYWEGSEYYPGQTYPANDDHTFTAKWGPKPTVPKTGDTARPALYLAFAALSALALLTLGRKHRRAEK